MIWLLAIPAAVAVAGFFAWKSFLSNEQKQHIDGKKIAILGARATGKSRFFEFIATGKLEQTIQHTPTKSKTPMNKKYQIPSVKRKFEDIEVEFDLVKSFDVGGSMQSYAVWKEVAQSADFLLYLIDAHRLFDDKNHDKVLTYKSNIKHDIAEIENLVRKRDEERPFERLVIVVNQIDKLAMNSDELEQRVFSSGLIKESQIQLGGANKCKLVTGSLKNEQTAEELLKQILLNL